MYHGTEDGGEDEDEKRLLEAEVGQGCIRLFDDPDLLNRGFFRCSIEDYLSTLHEETVAVRVSVED